MYMYDGHNLFYDEDATYGKSWGLKDYLDHDDKKMIIVGIECNHEGTQRLNEFCPYDIPHSYLGDIQGKGKILMDWVVNELKPYIDSHYPTIPFRECTGIGGSSMGGLMSLYTVIAYNQYFSKAACLSSAISFCDRQLKKELHNTVLSPDTRIYLSHGKRESKNPHQIKKIQTLLSSYQKEFSQRNISCHIEITDGFHNEASWEKEIPIFMDYLWKR